MNNKTVIHAEFGGKYVGKGDRIRWDSNEATVYALTFKEEITYEILVGRICKKLGIDQGAATVKLSYIPLVLKPPRVCLIVDDDDVDGYVWGTDKKHCRSSLNVEVIQPKQRVLTKESSVGLRRDSNSTRMFPNGEGERNGEGETSNSEADRERDGEGEMDGEEESNGEAEREMNGEAERGFNDCVMDVVPYVELPDEEVHEGQQFVEEWDDGTGLEIGQEFVAKEEVQNLLLRASLKECYDFIIHNSDSWRYVVGCSAEGCDWYLRVSRPQFSINEIWSVKTYKNRHTCSRASGSSSSSSKKKGTPQLVADIIHEEFGGLMETPPPKVLVDLVHSKVGVLLSYETARRGRHLAAVIIRGSSEDSYKKLPAYLEVLEKVNGGTKTSLLLDEENRFKYLFIALGACIRGYKVMRKVISVDATFLKYGGVLVFAMAQDPNHHHYPVALGVLDGENDASWDWFFKELLTVVPDEDELVFVTDRNISLIKAIRTVYKKYTHGYCVFHLSQNVREKEPSGSKEYVEKKFRELAAIYTQAEFDKEYADFRRRFPKVAVYLDESVTVDKWARCYSKGVRYNIETTNMSESMNSVFKKARMYALLPMIDAIVGKTSEWFNKHRKVAASIPMTHKMVPFVENTLHNNCKVGNLLKTIVLNSFLLLFSVIGEDGKPYTVDLRNLSCSCKHLDIDKYPCVHAVAAVLVYGKMPYRTVDMNVYDLCAEYFTTNSWALAYSEMIYTVPHESQCQNSDDVLAKVCLPPVYPRKRGRKKEKRFEHPGEGKRKKKKTSNKYVEGRSLAQWFS